VQREVESDFDQWRVTKHAKLDKPYGKDKGSFTAWAAELVQILN